MKSTKMDVQNRKDLILLLRLYIKKVVELNPRISWGNYEELTEKMDSVANAIERDIQDEKERYKFNNFYFSDFNGKSPQGEVWEYLDMNYPELREITHQIKEKLVEIKSN